MVDTHPIGMKPTTTTPKWAQELVTRYAAKPPPEAMNTHQLSAAMGLTVRNTQLKLEREVAAGKLQSGIFGRHKYYWPAK